MLDTNSIANLWQTEYEKKGIPSSFRIEPSGTLVDSLALLESAGFRGQIAIDIGCGTGRNSLYLAGKGYSVYSFDLVQCLVDRLKEQAEHYNMAGRIHAFCQSATHQWPLPDNICDLAIDTFCFKHLITSDEQRVYQRELGRVLRPGGFFILTLAGTDDGYYGPLLQSSANISQRLIVDPMNRIGSILYDKQDIEDLFGALCSTYDYEHKVKPGLMHGKEYIRSTHVFLMKRLNTVP